MKGWEDNIDEKAKVGELSVEGWEDLETYHFDEFLKFNVKYSTYSFVKAGLYSTAPCFVTKMYKDMYENQLSLYPDLNLQN